MGGISAYLSRSRVMLWDGFGSFAVCADEAIGDCLGQIVAARGGKCFEDTDRIITNINMMMMLMLVMCRRSCPHRIHTYSHWASTIAGLDRQRGLQQRSNGTNNRVYVSKIMLESKHSEEGGWLEENIIDS